MIGRTHNGIRRFCAWLIGVLFVISGVLKLMDPVGTSLIAGSYLKFLHLGFLGFVSKPLGCVIALLETVTGAALVSGVYRKVVAVVTSALLLFFTVLTVLLVVFNPAMDCGCFGEAVHLTHFQSLLKNLILVVLAITAFVPFRDFGVCRKTKYVSFLLASIAAFLFMGYSLSHIPLMDFTPFASGNKLLAAASETDGSLEFESTFIYSKDGKEECFTLENLPDSSWAFVRTETVSKQNLPGMPSLSIQDSQGQYADYLAVTGRVMTVSVYKHLSSKALGESRAFLELARENGFRPLLLTCEEEVEDSYRSDFKTLVSLNRSNGGATWIENGAIIRKYPGCSYPDAESLGETLCAEADEEQVSFKSRGNLVFQGFLLYVFAVLLLL